MQTNHLSAPAMNIHDSVTKSMLENYYYQKESVVDALKRWVAFAHIFQLSPEFTNFSCQGALTSCWQGSLHWFVAMVRYVPGINLIRNRKLHTNVSVAGWKRLLHRIKSCWLHCLCF